MLTDQIVLVKCCHYCIHQKRVINKKKSSTNTRCRPVSGKTINHDVAHWYCSLLDIYWSGHRTISRTNPKSKTFVFVRGSKLVCRFFLYKYNSELKEKKLKNGCNIFFGFHFCWSVPMLWYSLFGQITLESEMGLDFQVAPRACHAPKQFWRQTKRCSAKFSSIVGRWGFVIAFPGR